MSMKDGVLCLAVDRSSTLLAAGSQSGQIKVSYRKRNTLLNKAAYLAVEYPHCFYFRSGTLLVANVFEVLKGHTVKALLRFNFQSTARKFLVQALIRVFGSQHIKTVIEIALMIIEIN